MIALSRLFAKCTSEPPDFMQVYEISDIFQKSRKNGVFYLYIFERNVLYHGGYCNSNKDDRQTAQVSCLILCRYTKFQTFFAKAAKMAHFTLTFSRKKFPYYRGACSSNTDDRQNAQVKSHILCNYMIFQTFLQNPR